LEFGVSESLTLIALVGGSFIATSLDNLLVLVVLLGANPDRHSAVLAGFFASCLAVLCACALGLVLSSLFDPAVLGFLGLAPLLLGCHMLYQLYRGRAANQESLELTNSASESRVWLSAFTLLFANSGDSIAVFLPLFAESDRAPILVLVSSYLVAAILWGILSYRIAGRKTLALQVERRAEKLVPWIMIGIGIYILSDTATDTLI
jgi:cadmium resistance protein CadD (predicted permease)